MAEVDAVFDQDVASALDQRVLVRPSDGELLKQHAMAFQYHNVSLAKALMMMKLLGEPLSRI